MTTNEQAMLETINQLQYQVSEITQYLHTVKQSMDSIALPQDNIDTYNFYNLEEVDMYTSFPLTGTGTAVHVYVEEDVGKFREVFPILTFNGGCIQVKFDCPKTGYIVASDAFCTSAAPIMLCDPPYYNYSVLNLIEEIIEEPTEYISASVPGTDPFDLREIS